MRPLGLRAGSVVGSASIGNREGCPAAWAFFRRAGLAVSTGISGGGAGDFALVRGAVWPDAASAVEAPETRDFCPPDAALLRRGGEAEDEADVRPVAAAAGAGLAASEVEAARADRPRAVLAGKATAADGDASEATVFPVLDRFPVPAGVEATGGSVGLAASERLLFAAGAAATCAGPASGA